MKNRLLSVEEIVNLKTSSNRYYVVSSNSQVPDGIYTNIEGNSFRDNSNIHTFSKKCYGVECGNIKVYEYEEEIIIKEYTTVEAIRELDLNTELKFQALDITDTGRLPKFLESDKSKKIICRSESPNFNNTLFNDSTWVLAKPKLVEVTFLEAIKALDAGKDIKCEIGTSIYIYRELDNDSSLGYTLINYANGDAITTNEILKGKWYVL